MQRHVVSKGQRQGYPHRIWRWRWGIANVITLVTILILTSHPSPSPSSISPFLSPSPFPSPLLRVSAQIIFYPDVPIVWSTSGDTSSPTSGGGLLTITGEYFLTPGDCTRDPIIEFDYGGGDLVPAPLSGNPAFWDTWLRVSVPGGCGKPKVKVNICGQVARDLPRFAQDMLFWSGPNLPNDPNYCALISSSRAPGWYSSELNYLCSADYKQKAAQDKSTGTGTPLFTFRTGTVSDSGFRCTQMMVHTSSTAGGVYPVPSYASGWNSDNNRICVIDSSTYQLQWSMTGALPSDQWSCLPFLPRNDAAWSMGNYQLCGLLGTSPYPLPDTSMLYKYAAPVISTIDPPSGPTAGGITLTLTGTSFGDGSHGSTTVTVNGANCPVTSFSHKEIQCTLPPGNGKISLVQVTVCGTPSAQYMWSYDGPKVATVTPPLMATAGGTTLEITGLNFGLTGTVTVGGKDCPVVDYGFELIHCTAPAGMGQSVDVVVTSGGRSSTPVQIAYNKPSITGIDPTSADTLPGATVLTIEGNNLGTAGSVKVGGNSCPLTGIGWTDSKVQCSLPVGEGANQSVIVTAGGQDSDPFLFDYDPPTLSQLIPNGGAAGTSVQLRGTSFGLGDDVQLYMGTPATQVPLTSTAQKSVSFLVPAGNGIGIPIYLVVAGQTSTNQIYFSYAPVAYQATTTAGGPTQGGIPLTVEGINFGLSGSGVTVGGNNCTVTSQTDTKIICTLPAGSGNDQHVIVTTSTGLSSNYVLFSYDPPQLFGYLLWSPREGPAKGGTVIYLQGSSLGNAPMVLVDGNVCELIHANHTYIECSTPPGTGADKDVLVTAGAYTTDAYPFAYFPPNVTSIFPVHGPTSGGTLVTLTGTNFGSYPDRCVVATAGAIQTPTFQNDTYIIYQTPEGHGLVGVNVLVDSQPSNGMSFQYDTAMIESISPTTGRTDGGSPATLIDVYGSGFTDAGYVTVGGVQATLTGIGYTDTHIQFLLPAGQGYAPIIVVTAASSIPSSPFPFTYLPPTLDTIDPPTAATSGNILLTLGGSNFGQSGSIQIGGQTCTTQSPGTSWSFSKIVCLLPPGQGANLNVTLVVAGQSPATAPKFSYLPPSVSNVVPPSGSTVGGQSVTLYGSNFGLSAQINFLTPDGPACPLTGLGQSHIQIVCQVPAGQGLDVPIYVNVSGQVSLLTTASVYDYLAPTITSLTPLTAPTSGHTALVLLGSNFGLGSAYTLSLGGRSIPLGDVTFFNHTRVEFDAPVGTGRNLDIELVVAGQASSYGGALFSYESPTVSTVQGCSPGTDILPKTEGCSVDGGSVLTITGTNFGNDSSLISVTIGGGLTTCSPVTLLIDHTSLQCTLGSNPHGGFNLDVNVTVDGQSGSAPLLSFAGPIILPNTLRTTGDPGPPYSGNVTVVGDGSGFSVTFGGRFFGNNVSDLSIHYGLPGSSPKLFTCTPTAVSTDGNGDSEVTCTLSVGVGDGLVFILQSGLLTSTEGTDAISYAQPTIVANSIRGDPSNVRTDSFTGQFTEGDLVTFDVNNVPLSMASHVQVRYGLSGGPYDQVCTPVVMGTVGSIPYVSCTTSPGSGSGYHFVLWALNAQSNVGTDVYNYVTAPVVYSVSGCVDVGNTTTECPTAGGSTLDIRGDKFSQAGLSVRIGAKECKNVIFYSEQHLTCILDEGAGMDQGVTVIVGARFSRSVPYLSYAEAVVTSVSGCSDVGNSTENCARSGGTTLTLIGSNLGPPTAIVLVGGVMCSNVIHDATNPHGQLTCTLPPGTRTLRTIILIQNRGTLTVSDVTVSYAQCGTGTYAPSGETSCQQCDKGKYADVAGLTSCKVCSSGRYTDTLGKSSCDVCGEGTYSLATAIEGAQNCTKCGVGTYNDVPGSSECLDCQPGRSGNETGLSECRPCPAGFFADQPGKTSCQQCGVGHYYAFEGSVQCTECPIGRATNQLGQTQCAECSVGKIAAEPGMTACEECGAGSYVGTTGQGLCLQCDAGTFSNTTGLSSCYPCSPGEYVAKLGSLGATSCKQCLPGTYTNVYGQASCLECAQGSEAPEKGQSSCSLCIAGRYTDSKTGYVSCKGCPKGAFAPSNGSASCLLCGVGTYAPNPSMSSCLSCESGSVQPTPGQDHCDECAFGMAQPNPGQAECLPCDAGAFANVTGLSSCPACPSGSYSVRQSSTLGAAECTLCEPGRYSSVPGLSACLQCQPGSFSSKYGVTECERCPLGQSQSALGKTSCANCTIGRFAAVEGSITCTDCLEGTYGTQEGVSQCTLCPAGWVQPNPGQLFCSSCPSGYYSTEGQSECLACPAGHISGTNASACTPCEEGTYQDQPARSECKPCSAGSSQGATGSTFCPPCAAGTYQPSFGQASCLPCPRGQSTSETGAQSCTACSNGTFTETEGKLVCDACPVGKYNNQPGLSTCTKCTVGTAASVAGLSVCSRCEAGRYAPQPGSVSCVPCQAGFYAPDPGAESCFGCTPGRYQPMSEQTDCPICPAGTIADGDNAIACVACQPGKYSNEAADACLSCPKGSFSNTTGMTSCDVCPSGRFTDEEGQASCASCAVGTAVSTTNNTACDECEIGWYQDTRGQSNCVQCPVGRWQPLKGQSTCLSCDLGKFAAQLGSTNCTLCGSGKYQGQTGQASCDLCPTGSANDADGQSSCSLCDPGRFAPIEGFHECLDCGAGEFQAGSGATNCSACRIGEANTVKRQAACQLCDPGTYSNYTNNSVGCSPCPIMTYQDQPGMGTCELCPPGRSNDAIQQSECKLCDPGSFSDGYGAPHCTACPIGHEQPTNGGTNCTQCPLGRYAALNGTATCLLCPAGEFGNQTGLTACLRCGEGTFTRDPGSISCELCSAGRYNLIPGATECQACLAGSFSDRNGTTECEDCAKGRHQLASGASGCDECEVGRYNDATGQAQCSLAMTGHFSNETGLIQPYPCPRGTYQPRNGQTGCLPCYEGSFQNAEGQNECMSCPAGTAHNTTGLESCPTCPPGSSQPSTGRTSCVVCEAGKMSDAWGAITCSLCNLGRYTNQTNQTACETCEIGKYADSKGSTSCTFCEPGHYSGNTTVRSECLKCSAGSFVNATGATACERCHIGTAQPSTGRLACDVCGPGKASSTTGLSSCLDCAPGTFNNASGSTNCTECGPGEEQPLSGQMGCQLCKPGYFKLNPGPAPCQPCPAGHSTSKYGALSCDPCDRGYMQPYTGQTGCEPCTVGTASNMTGRVQCDECLPGQHQDEPGQYECKECGAGEYGPGRGLVQCMLCQAGRYFDGTGATMCQACEAGKAQPIEGQVECVKCAPGTAQPVPGQERCEPCSNGTATLLDGQRQCDLCQPGRFANMTGLQQCLQCPAGRAQASVGMEECDACPLGHAQDKEGQQYCSRCAIGTFAGRRSMVECDPCPIGYYGDEQGASQCKHCNDTYWTEVPGQERCTPCPVGTYGNSTGCQLCPPGSYNNHIHAAVCRKCEPGRYSSGWGQSQCQVCTEKSVASNYGMTQCVPCREHGKSNLDKTACFCDPGYYLPYYRGDSDYPCFPCPTGADCTQSGNAYYNLKSLPGWWRSSNSSLNFYRCPIRGNCQGSEASGGMLPYTGGDPSDPATLQHGRPEIVRRAAMRTLSAAGPPQGPPEYDRCGPPFFECATDCKGNRAAALCTQCLSGYRESMNGDCTPCPSGSGNVALTVLVVIVILIALWFMFWIVLRSGREAFNRHAAIIGQDMETSDFDGEYDDEEEDEEESDEDESDEDESNASSGVDSSLNSGASRSDESLSASGSESSESDLAPEEAEPSNLDPMVVWGPPPPHSDFTYKLKIFLGFLQVVTNISSGLEILWPNTFKDFILLFDVVNLDFLLSNVTSAQCLFNADYYYDKFVFVVTAPIGLLLATVMFILLPKYFECLCFKHSTVQERARSNMKFWKLFLYLLFLIYPNVSSTVLRHFVCKQIDDRSFLWTDLRIECYTDRWTTYAFVSIALILLYPVGIPVFFFSILKLNQRELKDVRIQAQLGFLYAGYRIEIWWWEIADCINKLALTSLLAFASQDAQLPLGMVIVTVYTVGLLYFNPFLRHEDDLLALFAQVEIYLLLLAGLLFYNLPLDYYNQKDDIIMSVALIILCIAFFAGFVFFVCVIARRMLLEFMQKRREKKEKDAARKERDEKRRERMERRKEKEKNMTPWDEESNMDEEGGEEEEWEDGEVNNSTMDGGEMSTDDGAGAYENEDEGEGDVSASASEHSSQMASESGSGSSSPEPGDSRLVANHHQQQQQEHHHDGEYDGAVPAHGRSASASASASESDHDSDSHSASVDESDPPSQSHQQQ